MTQDEFLMIDAEAVEAAQREIELARNRRLRYEARHPERKRHHGTNPDHNPNRPKYSNYRIVFWDGEAPHIAQKEGAQEYCIFGSSDGDLLCALDLKTEDFFDLLLSAKSRDPNTIHCIFGGRYDWDEICRRSMSLSSLGKLKNAGVLWWRYYKIKQVEGKTFEITHQGVHIKIFETFGWFLKSYLKSLTTYGIGTEAERAAIEKGKLARQDFVWENRKHIIKYMQLELKLGPPLMEAVRHECLTAGFNPRNWYGPSALATEGMGKAGIAQCIGDIPDAVSLAAQFAYAGGRFETFWGGIWTGPMYSYDENSAYMAAALLLPNLAKGTWRRGCNFEPGKFAVYHIRYNEPVNARDRIRLYPLFCRHENGSVNWPNKVEGWYWGPEAELVADSPYAEFLEAWIFDEETDERPFEFVREWYRKRMVLESLPESNPSHGAGKAFKRGLAAIYGQLARTVGWDQFKRTAPGYHCLEWAGFITSKCRADMFKVAKSAGTHLVSIDTDSVTATIPLVVPESTNIGDWKASQYDQSIIYQSGVFAHKKDGEWVERKARGVEEDSVTRRLPVSPEMMMSAIYDKRAIILEPRWRYTTVRMALNAPAIEKMGLWKEHPGDKLLFGGNGKRFHRESTCWQSSNPLCHGPESHVFTPRPLFSYPGRKPGEIPVSVKHYLPWKDSMPPIDRKLLLNDILFVSLADVEYYEEQEWLCRVA